PTPSQASPQGRPTTRDSPKSPSRRTAPHVTPEDLRRELSGSFGPSNNNQATSARTGRADAGTNTPGTPLNAPKTTEPAAIDNSAATEKSIKHSPALGQAK